MKNIKSINSESNYKLALQRVDKLILSNPKKESADYKELDFLGKLISAYEEIHYPISLDTPSSK